MRLEKVNEVKGRNPTKYISFIHSLCLVLATQSLPSRSWNRDDPDSHRQCRKGVLCAVWESCAGALKTQQTRWQALRKRPESWIIGKVTYSNPNVVFQVIKQTGKDITARGNRSAKALWHVWEQNFLGNINRTVATREYRIPAIDGTWRWECDLGQISKAPKCQVRVKTTKDFWEKFSEKIDFEKDSFSF